MITIVDYGLGNLGSVLNMLKKIGAAAEITSDPDKIFHAKKIILPGVGAFDGAMEKLTGTHLREVLDHKALTEKIPFLGICLGMQLLTEGSEEGRLKGLAWIPSYTYRFSFTGNQLKVPHMGWNRVYTSTPSGLTAGFDNDEFRFYFVHSYYVKVRNAANSILTTNYGLSFDSGIQHENIYGAQFHAEKSHRFGMKLFENFSKI